MGMTNFGTFQRKNLSRGSFKSTIKENLFFIYAINKYALFILIII